MIFDWLAFFAVDKSCKFIKSGMRLANRLEKRKIGLMTIKGDNSRSIGNNETLTDAKNGFLKNSGALKVQNIYP